MVMGIPCESGQFYAVWCLSSEPRLLFVIINFRDAKVIIIILHVVSDRDTNKFQERSSHNYHTTCSVLHCSPRQLFVIIHSRNAGVIIIILHVVSEPTVIFDSRVPGMYCDSWACGANQRKSNFLQICECQIFPAWKLISSWTKIKM